MRAALHRAGWLADAARKSGWLRLVIWLGGMACVYALYASRDTLNEGFASAGLYQIASCLVLLYGGWLIAVAAWRQFLMAWGGHCGWRDGFRQSAYLLVGKYLPGGVIGFMARLGDHGQADRKAGVMAGLSEQAAGIGLLVSCGAIAYAMPALDAWWGVVLSVAALTFAMSFAVRRVGPRVLSRFGSTMVPAVVNMSNMRAAIALTLLQQLVALALTALLAWTVLAIDMANAIGIAGAYALSIAIGMVAFFAPGGIGVRESAFVMLAASWLSPADGILIAALLRLVNMLLDVSAGVVGAMVSSRGH